MRLAEPCAYCGGPGQNLDHVIPRSIQKRLAAVPKHLAGTVSSCVACNMRKGTRKLVPPSWADRIPEIKAIVPGKWRVWNGDPKSPAYRETHK